MFKEGICSIFYISFNPNYRFIVWNCAVLCAANRMLYFDMHKQKYHRFFFIYL